MEQSICNCKQNSTDTAVLANDDVLALVNSLQLDGVNRENKDSIFAHALEQILDFFGADRGFICLADQKDKLEIAASNFSAGSECPITQNQQIIDKCMQTGSTEVTKDASSDIEIRSALCAAVKAGEEIFGTIYIGSTEVTEWSDKQIELLEFVGIHMGLASKHIENKRLIEAGTATLNLSHSVKNILQMIGGAAEVIEYGLKNDEIKRVSRSWEILYPNLERLRKFMLDMLDYSKDRKLEIDQCDFNQTIKGSIKLLKSKIQKIGSLIVLVEDREIPVIELDSERIHEMSLNIILNAMDIVDHETGVVRVETKYLPETEDVQLIVSDNGPGMTDEIKKKIFTPFKSGKNKLGTGLGMAIAKQIVDQHKGTIKVDSQLGEGTIFTVTLPAKVVNK